MNDPTSRLSDAAKAVAEGTIARLQSSLSQLQLAALRELASTGRLFDVESLVALEELAAPSTESNHGD